MTEGQVTAMTADARPDQALIDQAVNEIREAAADRDAANDRLKGLVGTWASRGIPREALAKAADRTREWSYQITPRTPPNQRRMKLSTRILCDHLIKITSEDGGEFTGTTKSLAEATKLTYFQVESAFRSLKHRGMLRTVQRAGSTPNSTVYRFYPQGRTPAGEQASDAVGNQVDSSSVPGTEAH